MTCSNFIEKRFLKQVCSWSKKEAYFRGFAVMQLGADLKPKTAVFRGFAVTCSNLKQKGPYFR
eukprot:2371447-Amphidinium_carterae.1